jgi:hypothetical protein
MLFLPSPLAMKIYAAIFLVSVGIAFFRPALTQSRALPMTISAILCLFLSKLVYGLAFFATVPWMGSETVSVYARPAQLVILAAIFAIAFRKTRDVGLRLLQLRLASTRVEKQ